MNRAQGMKQKRGYVSWTPQMDAILIAVLYEQLNEGNKGDGEWKPQAYQAVVDRMKRDLDKIITVEHAKNRLKSWKKQHANVMEIRTTSKFRWDDTMKMITIGREELNDWTIYCEANPFAKQYGNKVVDYWDDLCVLVGPDRADGDDAEHIEESAAAMDREVSNEEGSTSKDDRSRTKRLKADRLADAVTDFAQTFKEYMAEKRSSLQPQPKPSVKEIHEILKNINGLLQSQVLKATKRFMNGTMEEFQMLKDLPEEDKLEWVLLCLED